MSTFVGGHRTSKHVQRLVLPQCWFAHVRTHDGKTYKEVKYGSFSVDGLGTRGIPDPYLHISSFILFHFLLVLSLDSSKLVQRRTQTGSLANHAVWTSVESRQPFHVPANHPGPFGHLDQLED